STSCRTCPLEPARGLRNLSGVFEDAEPGSAVGHIEQSVLPQDDVVRITPRVFRPAGIDLISEVARLDRVEWILNVDGPRAHSVPGDKEQAIADIADVGRGAAPRESRRSRA